MAALAVGFKSKHFIAIVPSMTFLRTTSNQERIATSYSAGSGTTLRQNTPAHPLRL
jgi:hypothetical protein